MSVIGRAKPDESAPFEEFPIVSLECRDPGGSNSQSQHWAAKREVRRWAYAELLCSLRSNPRWERAVLHPGFPERRKVVFIRGLAGADDLGKRKRRLDNDGMAAGLKGLRDTLKIRHAGKAMLGLIAEDSPRWILAEYTNSKDVAAGRLRILIYRVKLEIPK